MNSDLLLKTAEVLEKLAEYHESIERGRVQQETASREKEATLLAEKLTEATGEPVDSEMVKKLAGLDPEIASYLDRVAGKGFVDSMGGPREETSTIDKVASEGMPQSDARFLSFILSD